MDICLNIQGADMANLTCSRDRKGRGGVPRILVHFSTGPVAGPIERAFSVIELSPAEATTLGRDLLDVAATCYAEEHHG